MLVLIIDQLYSSEIIHRSLSSHEQKNNFLVWEGTSRKEFDELIVSWSGDRPQDGSYSIQISVKLLGVWTPWVDYAFWGAKTQYTFKQIQEEVGTRVEQDCFWLQEGDKTREFRIRVGTKNRGSLENFRELHVCLTDRSAQEVDLIARDNTFLELNCPGLSQMQLSDPRNFRLCSPTSTTAVIRFLSGSNLLSPLDFADRVIDAKFDIYGNWILNTSQASHELGKNWRCFVVKLTSFNQVIDQLEKGCPVVVSVQGPLPGSATPYASGHLLVVKGYDSKNGVVLCMDPAFPSDELTDVRYLLVDFLSAWRRRHGLSYVFERI